MADDRGRGAGQTRVVAGRSNCRVGDCRVLSSRSGRIDAALLVVARRFRSRGVAVAGTAHLDGNVGFLYAGSAEIASVLVRLDRAEGFAALILILLVVWVTDIGGYFAGSWHRWPETLAVRVSPNKTWAGAIGGFVASLVVAAGFAAFGRRQDRPVAGCWARSFRSFPNSAISLNPL